MIVLQACDFASTLRGKKAPPTRAAETAKRAGWGVSNDLCRRSLPDVRAYPVPRPLPTLGSLMAVSRRLRFEVLKRDNYTCRYCGAKAPDVTLTVDHVIPTTLGGGDDPTNLVTACEPCNSGKASVAPESDLVAEVDAAALLWAKAIERANAIRSTELQEADAVLGAFDAYWKGCLWSDNDCGRPWPGWDATVITFLHHGLTLEELMRYVDAAFMSRASSRNTWRYFCGCCWREITRRQELARTLIEDGKV